MPEFQVIRRGDVTVAVIGYSEPSLDEFVRDVFRARPVDYVFDESTERLSTVISTAVRVAEIVVVAGDIGPERAGFLIERHSDDVDAIISSNSHVRNGLPIRERHLAGGFVGDTLLLVNPSEDRVVLFATVDVVDGHLENLTLGKQILDGSVGSSERVDAALNRFYSRLPRSSAAYSSPIGAGTSFFRDSYVDEALCQGCHTNEAKQWAMTAHATAFNAMLQSQRQHSAECIRCHVTGFGWQSGYLVQTPSPDMRNVGCQSCHGAGGEHASQPSKGNILGAPTRETCQQCHNQEHSPPFASHFGNYWDKVVHSRSK